MYGVQIRDMIKAKALAAMLSGCKRRKVSCQKPKTYL
jgi:hypothetical protein